MAVKKGTRPMSNWRPNITTIEDPIAEDLWSYPENGKTTTVRIQVGRPRQLDDNSDWYCPLLIEGHLPAKPVFGAGPVDALMNAMGLVRSFFESHEITPQG